MKNHIIQIHTTLLLFLSLFSFGIAEAVTPTPFNPQDINSNGIVDSVESQVVVSNDIELPSGEYVFKNLTVTNNAVLLLKGDQNSPSVFKGVKITAENITVTEGAQISAYGTGYRNLSGPGAPAINYAGASYGGIGLNNSAISTYGSATAPTDLGSGGAENGGGALWLVVSGTLENNGVVTAIGKRSGSGGSVYVQTNVLSGKGVFNADGGSLYGTGYFQGPGGGGRVALYSKYSNGFSGKFTASGGCGSYDGYTLTCAGKGTAGLFDETNNDLYIHSSWRFQKNDGPFVLNRIILAYGAKVTNEEGARIKASVLSTNSAGEIEFSDNQILDISEISLNFSKITFSGKEVLTAHSLTLNGESTVTVRQDRRLFLTIPTIKVSSNSIIHADGKGFGNGTGFGAPNELYGGASYGGIGSLNTPQSTYGSANEPLDMGSSGHGNNSYGGGAIRLTASTTLENNGIISADGLSSGSGGSIYVTAGNLSGSGQFRANGGPSLCLNQCYGPGGGGRIALYHYNQNAFTGSALAEGYRSTSGNSTKGTVVQSIIECADCTSNVLFLPGLMASRLYEKESGPSCLNCEDQLWEPNWNSDVEDLYLNTDGTSKNPNIYTRDIIKESNTPLWTGSTGQNIYKSFSSSMDKMVSDKKMTEWKAFPYDWRLSPDDVVVTPQKLENNKTSSLIDTLEQLSASSKSGKVTIVAHSNGGLVAKALLKKLQDDKTSGKNNLLDKVDVLILVASPQLGTPSAVPAILHGYDQRIFSGLLLDEIHARELGKNMPGAYGLLPSQKYIQTVPVAPVTFTKTTLGNEVTAPFISAYGSTTDTYLEFQNFLKGNEGRISPQPDNILSPITLSNSLLSKSEALHTSIDNWIPPASLKVIQIAGWGIDTIAGFEYVPKQTCIKNTQGAGCTNKYILDQKPIFTADGDKTVVTPSALGMSGEKWWVDLLKTNNVKLPFQIQDNHKNILEINSIIDLISNTLQKTSVSNLSYLSTSAPTTTTNRLRLAVHSPVTLSAYDTQGNHTGKICSTTSDFCFIEENIPNSSYVEFGEGKYINLPEENLKNVQLAGTDIGTFTFESEKVLPSGVVETSIFKNVPVTTQTKVEITLNTATSKPELKLDIDGNGNVDTVLQPKAEFDPIVYLETMKKVVGSLNMVRIRKEMFYRKVEKVVAQIQAGKVFNASQKVQDISRLLNEKTGGSTQTQGGILSVADTQTLYVTIFRLIDLIK